MNSVQAKMDVMLPQQKKTPTIMMKKIGSNNRPVKRMAQNQKPMMRRMGVY
jgi:hypothetical protein